MTLRALETEHDDNAQRRYAYDHDYRMHDYMIREWSLPHGSRALEMGCYKGAFTAKLTAIYDEVTVLEGAADLIEIARHAAPSATFVHGRFEDVHSEANPFDAIFLIHALEHVDDPLVVLRNAKSWLSETGRLYVAVPNAYAASRQIAVEMGLVPYTTAVTEGELQHGHRRTYGLGSLRHDVIEAGLKTVEFGGIFFKPLSNHQLDLARSYGVLSDGYLEGCYKLGRRYPNLCSSVYCVATR